MPTQVQFRRGTAIQNDSFKGANGELTIDLTNKSIRVHDGNTVGGYKIATNSELLAVSTTLSSAFAQANAANVLAYNTGIGANAYATAIGIAGNNYTITVGAAANAIAIAAFDTANNVGPQIAPAFNQANVANATAIAAFNKANAANVLAYNTGIGANAYATAIGIAANAYMISVQNGSNTAIGAGANAYADATFVKLIDGNQTITGDILISGNLFVTGNTTTVSSQDLVVEDPLFLLANNNTTDVSDIGFVAHYANATSYQVHTGLIRDPGTKQWYLFKEYNDHFFYTGGNIDLSANNFTIDTLNANFVTNNLTLNGVNASVLIKSSFDKANAALPNISGSTFNGSLIVSSNITTPTIFFSDGSNSSPSIAFSNSTNTGIYRTSNNQIAFSILGEQTLVISDSDATDNVLFEILNDAEEPVFTISANTTGNVFEVYDANNTTRVLLAVNSNEVFVNNNIDIQNNAFISTNTATALTNTQIELTRFSSNAYSGGRFTMMARMGSNTHMSELNILHDGTTAYYTEYGIIYSNISLYDVVADVNVGNVRILVTPTQNTSTTFRILESKLV